ncbi:MAG: hypothetical protein KC777_14015 [Cyanobacteria bacterium HKST-UBA02]|nr:hypothetical protein [Cyanobacteria bacterium HKST-UBA02]
MLRITLLSALILFLALATMPACQASPGYSRLYMKNAESSYIQARQQEQSGFLDDAARGYRAAIGQALNCSKDPSFLNSVRMGGDSLGTIGRRAITLQKKIVSRIPDSARDVHSVQARMELNKLYKSMQKVEPDNPTWFYLDAVMLASKNNYMAATIVLKRALLCKSGSPAVKEKAKSLLSHIQGAGEQQRKWFVADNARQAREFQECVKRYGLLSVSSPSSSHPMDVGGGNSSSSMPDWERRARDAESRGDYGAADRFRSGSNTVQDSSTHW